MTWTHGLKKRLPVWKSILWRRVVLVVTVAWAVLSNFPTVRDDLMPERLRDHLSFIPRLPTWSWAILLLVLLLFAVMEGAYKEISQRDAIIDASKPRPRGFGDLIQLHGSEQYHDINLSLVNTAETDWFTVSVIDVQPREAGDDLPLPWDVKWSDVTGNRRHVPKNSTALLRLCRIESKDSDKNRRATTARFFTAGEDIMVTLSLAAAWNAQDICIGYHMVIPEIRLRITAEGAKQTLNRKLSLTLNEQLQPYIYRMEVLAD